VRILELEAAGVECKTAISTRPEVREAFDMLAAGIANHRLSQSFEAFSKNTALVVKASSQHCEFISLGIYFNVRELLIGQDRKAEQPLQENTRPLDESGDRSTHGRATK